MNIFDLVFVVFHLYRVTDRHRQAHNSIFSSRRPKNKEFTNEPHF